MEVPPPPPPPPSTEAFPPPAPFDSLPPPPPPPSELEPELVHSKPKEKKGWGAKPKTTPLDVEELVRKKKEADRLAAKPKFMSRAERERLALEQRSTLR